MDKICISELVVRLKEDYVPSNSNSMASMLERSEFERGKLAGILSIIDSLERIVEDKDSE